MQDNRVSIFSKTGLGFFLSTVMIAGLVGCSSPKTKVEEDLCPQIRVPVETSSITRYAGNIQNLSDITYVAKIVPTAITCSKKGNEVTANITLRIAVEEGKVNKNNPVEFQYFVAIVDPQEQILSKQAVVARVTFAKGKPFMGIEDLLEQKLVITSTYAPSDYYVVIGLMLNEAELQRLNLQSDQ